MARQNVLRITQDICGCAYYITRDAAGKVAFVDYETVAREQQARIDAGDPSVNTTLSPPDRICEAHKNIGLGQALVDAIAAEQKRKLDAWVVAHAELQKILPGVYAGQAYDNFLKRVLDQLEPAQLLKYTLDANFKKEVDAIALENITHQLFRAEFDAARNLKIRMANPLTKAQKDSLQLKLQGLAEVV